MKLTMLLTGFLVSFAGIVIGLFLIKKPGRVIDLQKAFYLGINWKMEPVSLSREITSTRIMGFLLTVISVLSFLVCLVRFPHVFLSRC
ncbi:MAG: hypothetical protein NTU54_02295 [Candidatus Omnitrophica bacterium]|nr:hypothetical protein [Candidatus Omnitrophota bacterium]